MDKQGELIALEDLPDGYFDALEQAQGVFTGDRLRRERPETYAAIVKFLGQGLGRRLIARMCGVSHNTVAAVRSIERPAIDTEKKEAAGMFDHAARMSVEYYLEKLEEGKVPAASAVMAAGIFQDKAMLLRGDVTGRIESISSAPKHADVNALIDSLPCVDVIATPVGERGNLPKKELSPATSDKSSDYI